MLFFTRLQDHVGPETVSVWVVILGLKNCDLHDCRLGEMTVAFPASARNTLTGASEHIPIHTDATDTDWLGSLAGGHLRNIDDAPIVRAMISTTSASPECTRHTMQDALPGLDGQSTNLSHSPSGSGEGRSLSTRFHDDLRLEIQMHTNPTLVSVLVVNQGNCLVYAVERFDRSKLDPGGSQAFGLLDLVPVENFKLEVRRNARRLKFPPLANRQPHMPGGHTHNRDSERLIPFRTKCFLLCLGLEHLLAVEGENNVGIRFT